MSKAKHETGNSHKAQKPKVRSKDLDAHVMAEQIGVLQAGLRDVMSQTDNWQKGGAQHSMKVIRETAANALIAAEAIENDPSLVADLGEDESSKPTFEKPTVTE
jgi:hypothetical protein